MASLRDRLHALPAELDRRSDDLIAREDTCDGTRFGRSEKPHVESGLGAVRLDTRANPASNEALRRRHSARFQEFVVHRRGTRTIDDATPQTGALTFTSREHQTDDVSWLPLQPVKLQLVCDRPLPPDRKDRALPASSTSTVT
jgi:hypothetical protein